LRDIVKTELLIITAPFTYTFGPALAPALLKACCEKENIQTTTWDVSADFNFNYEQHPYYASVIGWMRSPDLQLTQQEFDWYTNIVADYAKFIIEKYQPTNLAISLLTQNSQRFTEDICYYVKLINAEINIILGGSGMDIFQYQYQKKWCELMLDSCLVDAVLLGEGEFALPIAIKNNQTGIIKVQQLSNAQLNLVPIPDYNDYDFNLYGNTKKTYWSPAGETRTNQAAELIFLITASKGCVKNCNFCDVGNIWSKFRFRSGQHVADEIIHLYKKYNATYFSFTDSLMNGGLKPFFEMNKILADQLPKSIKYEGQIICRSQQDMPEKYFEIMGLAGCDSVSIGIESGSEQVRMHMGKGSSQADIYYTTEMLAKYNIKQSWNIIAGYPTETDDDWQNTLELITHWVARTNGLLTIIPIDTFMLLDNTPLTEPDMFRSMQLTRSVVNGYSGFAWTSGLNPKNTFDVRAQRFIELCNLLLGIDPVKYAPLSTKIVSTTKQLDWYTHENICSTSSY